MHRSVSLSIIIFTLVSTGCAEESDHEDVGTETCEHMQEGPNTVVTAVADAAGALSAVTAPHTRFDIMLVDFEGMKGGWVKYEAGVATDYVIAVNVNVPLSVTDSAEQPIAIEVSEPNPDCDEVVMHYAVKLPVGTARFKIGPTEQTELRVVIEEAAE